MQKIWSPRLSPVAESSAFRRVGAISPPPVKSPSSAKSPPPAKKLAEVESLPLLVCQTCATKPQTFVCSERQTGCPHVPDSPGTVKKWMDVAKWIEVPAGATSIYMRNKDPVTILFVLGRPLMTYVGENLLIQTGTPVGVSF